jgi:hypothetical protein
MEKSKCPLCSSDVIIDDDAYEGDPVNCANCGADLEIASLHPASLKVMRDEDENDEQDERDDNGY